MIDISKTEYADNFCNEAAGKVSVLDDTEAASVYEAIFGKGVNSFFDLPDHHWFIKAEKRNIGQWIECYNFGNNEPVQSLLRKAVGWSLSDEVYYLAKRTTIFKSDWSSFTCWWDAFLASEDDATIVLRALNRDEILMFTALGEIRHVFC